ncbi:cytochrome o ubiquinol oxidase subunit IV [Ottowia sp.]|jgi:cytochrome o ubiquinol oxidase operon protein cyoD|uniref:cytochrome o ubiquinol oxidase subunit IV n=1 Tax=Ottowia sp. TaxID=1898956 RepID=UPI0025FBEE36|nr:cytochrome o ubiquinol oxidase subunit IV [Ottowia sp.]MBK6615658.1 cytochrome o ubiquinol oxidase subunit IV [Ottowia sp.]MBK6746726.1 cytochrome o ubiquinol oxidase subunit IV [Ottowia sp.]
MSAQDVHGGAAHGHDDHHHDDGPHSTVSAYIIGFFLSVVLTAIPFWLVMAKVIDDRGTAVLALGSFAVVQILVHMVCFLHMNGKAEGGWTLLSTIFSIVFVAVTIAGTLWVMLHMNTLMMPGHGEHAAAAAERTPAAAETPAARQGYGGAATN